MRSYGALSIGIIYFIEISGGFFPELRRNTRSIPYKTTGNEGEPLFLTPFIEKGLLEKAEELAKVQPDIGNVTSYSGFLTVNKKCESNLFFWFFPAQSLNWKELPLLLWLQGGPGDSSMQGLFMENGPFEMKKEGLKTREYSWNKNINVIYIDQPVGTGFSFTSKKCYPQNGTAVGEELYSAIVQFHQLFPNFQANKFFVSGESYAGHFIPALGYAIHIYNPTAEVKINLETMIIGSGWMDPVTQNNYGPFLYEIGLIDQAQKTEYDSTIYKQFLLEVASENWEEAFRITIDLIKRLFFEHVGNKVSAYNYLHHQKGYEIIDEYEKYLQSSEIHKALHVGNKSFIYYNFEINEHYLRHDRVQSVKPWVEELLEHYPIVFYNGQLDIICAYPMMTEFLRTLQWSGQNMYLQANRTKWCVDQVCTYSFDYFY